MLVTSPRREAIDEGIFFHRRLQGRGAAVRGRDREPRAAGRRRRPTRAALVGPAAARSWARKVYDSYEATRRLAERDQANLDLLRRRLGRTPLIEVPHLADDVHDLDGLRLMDEYLFG